MQGPCGGRQGAWGWGVLDVEEARAEVCWVGGASWGILELGEGMSIMLSSVGSLWEVFRRDWQDLISVSKRHSGWDGKGGWWEAGWRPVMGPLRRGGGALGSSTLGNVGQTAQPPQPSCQGSPLACQRKKPTLRCVGSTDRTVLAEEAEITIAQR